MQSLCAYVSLFHHLFKPGFGVQGLARSGYGGMAPENFGNCDYFCLFCVDERNNKPSFLTLIKEQKRKKENSILFFLSFYRSDDDAMGNNPRFLFNFVWTRLLWFFLKETIKIDLWTLSCTNISHWFFWTPKLVCEIFLHRNGS